MSTDHDREGLSSPRRETPERPTSEAPAAPAREHAHARPSVAGSRRVHGASHSGPLHRTHAQPRPHTHGEAAGAPAGFSAAGAFTDVSDGTDAHRPSDAAAADGAEAAHQAQARPHEPQEFVPLWEGDDPARAPHITRRVLIAGGIAAAAAFALLGIPALRAMMPISVTVNGQQVRLSGDKTLQAALDESGIVPVPGNLVDIEGEVIAEGQGTPYLATINGQQTDDAQAAVADGDTLAFADGADVEEPSTTEDRSVEANPVDAGYGPIHALETQGTPGISSVKTGQTSGKEVVVEVKQEPEDRVYRRSYPDTGDDKAIALTFDDGPWENSTAAILDILRDHGAVATFFTVGQRISGEGVDLVKREYAEGHQICTHTWDHASGSGQGVNLGFMTADEQRTEIEKGRQAIADATGAEANRIMRAPGGNFSLDVWRNVEDLIDADIGWDIDTLDWKRPGAATIAARIKGATPGDIILMHDGGGDRLQTAEALRDALPYLKDQGFRFVTIDEMMKFPRKNS